MTFGCLFFFFDVLKIVYLHYGRYQKPLEKCVRLCRCECVRTVEECLVLVNVFSGGVNYIESE